MKEVKTDKMQSEKRILGIPVVTFVIIVIALCGITFYASSYASENSKILQKHESTQAELYSINRQLEKMGKKFKMCTSNLKQYEESNRDLKHRLTEANTAKSIEKKKNIEYQSQVSNFHQFYLNVKEYAGTLKDSDKSNEGVTNTELDEVMGTLKSLKEKQEEAIQKEKENTKKSEEGVQAKIQEIEQQKNTVNEMKEEVSSVRKLLEEKEDEISNMVREKEKPGFRKKKPQPEQSNVKMIDMNKMDGKDQKASKPETVAPQTTTPVKGQERLTTKTPENAGEEAVKGQQQPLTTKTPENAGASNDGKANGTAPVKKDVKPTESTGLEKLQSTTEAVDKKKSAEKRNEEGKNEVEDTIAEVQKLEKQGDALKTKEKQDEDQDFDDHFEGDDHEGLNE